MTWIVAEDPYEVKVVRNVDIDVVWHLYEDGDFELSDSDCGRLIMEPTKCPQFKLISATDPDGNEVELSDKEVEDAENKAIDEYWDCMKDKNDG
tara:strand:+ start:82 stop:363 length:282 start_codon:yes stop_codon:yes gene_type:complete